MKNVQPQQPDFSIFQTNLDLMKLENEMSLCALNRAFYSMWAPEEKLCQVDLSIALFTWTKAVFFILPVLFK